METLFGRRCQRDPHQNQYVPPPLGFGDIDTWEQQLQRIGDVIQMLAIFAQRQTEPLVSSGEMYITVPKT